MTSGERADRLISAATKRAPDLVALARFLSLAVFVEPELLRAMRAAIFPRSGPDLEGALWFSPLVESHAPGGVSLRREVASALREQMRQDWRHGRQRSELERARRLVERMHADISPALALEERVYWFVVVDDQAAVEGELASALKAHAAGGRPGVAAWAAQAWQRLPDQARHTRAGWLFQQMARSTGTVPIAQPKGDGPSQVNGEDVSAVLGFLRDVPLGIRLGEHDVEIGALGDEATMAIEVPDTDPRVLDVVWRDSDGTARDRITVGAGKRETIERGSETLTLKNLRGQVYELSYAYPPRFKSAPAAVVLVVGRAHNLSTDEVEYARAVGDALARAGHHMIDGGLPGVDYLAGEAFAKALHETAPEVAVDARLTHFVQSGTEPDYKPGARREIYGAETWHAASLLVADAVVLVGGDAGTEMMYLLARDADIPVFAVRASGGVALAAADQIAQHTGPGLANCDGLPETTLEDYQLVRRNVRAYLTQAGPREGAQAIASVVAPRSSNSPGARRDAMRWIWEAVTYLGAETLDRANSIMSSLWDASLKERNPSQLAQERWRLHSSFAADRVLGYVSVQVAPGTDDAHHLIEAAAIEHLHASETRGTKPLYQLLVGFQRLLDHHVVSPDQAVDVKACLTEIRDFLHSRDDLDRGHQCRTHAENLLRRIGETFPDFIDEEGAAVSLADLPDSELYVRLEGLARDVGKELRVGGSLDTYFFLVRIGDNFDHYQFNWEPFRDLAGPLRPSAQSRPVIVISEEDDHRTTVTKTQARSPIPHTRLHISPNVPLMEIVSTWLDTIIENGARINSGGPFHWFLNQLELDAAALSPGAREFLGVERFDRIRDPAS